MPVKASDIQKMLPENGKKNCKECGLATCFAFAMKLANAGITLDKCTYLSAEVRLQLEDMLQPPIRQVFIGTGARQVAIGEEEVMFRHQKTFFRAPGMALLIADGEDEESCSAKIAKIGWQFERLDKLSRFDLVALSHTSTDGGKYLQLVQKVMAETDAGLILLAAEPEVLLSAYEASKSRNPLVCVTDGNYAQVVPHLAKSAVVCASADGLDNLANLVGKLKEAGLENLVLDPGSGSLVELVRDQTMIRRAALLHKFRPFGFPTLFLAARVTSDLEQQMLLAVAGVAKYAGIIVLDDISSENFQVLLTVRQNIYTDPRVPPTVESKVYGFNEADESAAVLVTTNFALTYYAVTGEVENSKLPVFLCCQDTGGLCVLAAWSTGTFGPETIAEMVKKQALADKVTHKQLVLPGYVARIKGDLEEELPDWEILVGPREAVDIPNYLNELKKRRENVA
ncbi:acetyl-CoA decarbonylase/synthase, CODH/ACS complex subunit gamma [Candidatus Hakubella thermalkaliphila]|uniref:Acetyl-CoA decarbonylase/synthase, CODH/ACS complex subunit gamma n=1 Tax=Candidatus Hakubella thermalkaliphila TaxID=2754717 RepID=A0A6V8NTN3_9ACTN|nr:acetyl-CoA decarbonylase/synthase, CODH/ACS complex subunit gamma [Candidatus Hakubella thermalkaliphila]